VEREQGGRGKSDARPDRAGTPSVLVLEPYYGGSHKVFCDALVADLPFRFTLWTLPARKWKWRMRLAAPLFAGRLAELAAPQRLVFCSSFVDVATLRGCGPAWLRQVPVVTYFHENQFAYPVQVEDERDYHFAVTNVTTALASDLALFNSQYNLETFLDGARKLLRKAPDMDLAPTLDRLAARCRVLPPGIDFAAIDQAVPWPRPPAAPPVILWNHRWEHDKGPELFFAALDELAARSVDFEVVVLGRGFARRPAVFDTVAERLGRRLLHCGWVTRQEYGRWLRRCDVVVSTARHEFYGMAVLEAVRAGCRPVLPDGLSYRELFPAEYRYPEGGLVDALVAALERGRLDQDTAATLTTPHAWDTLQHRFAACFSTMLAGGPLQGGEW